jgi:hypothetical protein
MDIFRYTWDTNFTQANFGAHIMRSNIEDIDEWRAGDFERRLQRHGITCGDQLNGAQRMTSASNVKDLLCRENDVRMPILLPIDFALYANELIRKVLVDAGVKEINLLEPAVHEFKLPAKSDATRQEGLFLWSIGHQFMWQQFDRRIDE